MVLIMVFLGEFAHEVKITKVRDSLGCLRFYWSKSSESLTFV